MTVRWKFIVVLSVLVLSFSSCKEDTGELLDLDQVATEQNETNIGSQRSCDLTKKMDNLMSNPDYRKVHEEKFSKLNKVLNKIKSRSSCAAPTIVPMAIHFQGIPNPDQSCLVALAQSQVDILNKDFTGTNADISKWTNQASAFFSGVSNGEACLQFCLADQGHPNGYGVSNGSPAVTINKTNGDFSADWSGYINIYVRANTGALGYSPLGGAGNGDGVVIDANAFGTGGGCGSVSPNAPFDLGRTLTHELGHYLFLDHIWGNGCNVDDQVDDTPDQQQEYYNCPAQGSSSCGSNDMHMSYMDYANDACMYMFSAGQVNRMEAYIVSSLSNVTSNATNVCSISGGGNNGGGTTSACTTPSAGTVTHINPTSVKVTWTAVPDAIKYRIRYRLTGTSIWTTVNTTPPTKTIQNLTADTEYQFQLRAQCPTGWTTWSITDTFTTQPNQSSQCVAPGQATVESLNSQSVKVLWAAVPQATKYRIRFREVGTAQWIVYSPTNPQITL